MELQNGLPEDFSVSISWPVYLSALSFFMKGSSNYEVKNPPINIHTFNFRCSVHCAVVRQSLGGWCEQLGLCDCETVWWHTYSLLFGVLSCAEGQTLPPPLFAEWLNGPADEMWWLHWAPSIPTVGALKWLGSWLGCSSADPELQTCLENSPHPPLSKKVLVKTDTFSLKNPACMNTYCKVAVPVITHVKPKYPVTCK